MPQDLEIPVAWRDRDQPRERPVVAGKRRELAVAEVAARARQPRTIGELAALADAVVAGVVDDPAVGRLLDHGRATEPREPLGSGGAAAHRVDHQVRLDRTRGRPHAGYP